MLLATFFLRLALGLAGALWLVSTAQVNPRFYRTQFLTILGLTTVAAALLVALVDWLLGCTLVLTIGVAFLGAMLWSTERVPFGRLPIVLNAPLLLACLALTARERLLYQVLLGSGHSEPMDTAALAGPVDQGWLLAQGLSAAALLGTATTAMLMGHSYLVAPNMSMTPLLRLLAGMFVALGLRVALASWGLFRWTETHSLANLNDEAVLWLPVRWGLGFVGPLVLGWMAWQTARIRSTQSATGILYVVVVFCYLGELTSQLLCQQTGYAL